MPGDIAVTVAARTTTVSVTATATAPGTATSADAATASESVAEVAVATATGIAGEEDVMIIGMANRTAGATATVPMMERVEPRREADGGMTTDHRLHGPRTGQQRELRCVSAACKIVSAGR